MTTLTQYGLMAEEALAGISSPNGAGTGVEGRLQEMLLEAEEKTKDEMEEITRNLISEQGYTPYQAERAAWEIVRERYILLPPEVA